MIRTPHLEDGDFHSIYQGMLAYQHHLVVAEAGDRMMDAERIRVGRIVNELSECLFGEAAEPMVLPDFDYPPDTTFATWTQGELAEAFGK